MENQWFEIAQGRLTDKEINNQITSLKKKFIKAERDTLGDKMPPKSKGLEIAASQLTTDYFRRFQEDV